LNLKLKCLDQALEVNLETFGQDLSQEFQDLVLREWVQNWVRVIRGLIQEKGMIQGSALDWFGFEPELLGG
jgi:hypothetical protein